MELTTQIRSSDVCPLPQRLQDHTGALGNGPTFMTICSSHDHMTTIYNVLPGTRFYFLFWQKPPHGKQWVCLKTVMFP